MNQVNTLAYLSSHMINLNTNIVCDTETQALRVVWSRSGLVWFREN
jgi:hypothetical protein